MGQHRSFPFVAGFPTNRRFVLRRHQFLPFAITVIDFYPLLPILNTPNVAGEKSLPHKMGMVCGLSNRDRRGKS